MKLLVHTEKGILTLEIGIIFYCIAIPNDSFYNTQPKSDWLFDTQSIVLRADWSTLGNYERSALSTFVISRVIKPVMKHLEDRGSHSENKS